MSAGSPLREKNWHCAEAVGILARDVFKKAKHLILTRGLVMGIKIAQDCDSRERSEINKPEYAQESRCDLDRRKSPSSIIRPYADVRLCL